MASQPIIRRPLKPAQKGETPTLEWARWVESTLRRLIDVPPPRQRPITGGGFDPQFKIYAVRYDTEDEKWYCKVRPGWVRSRNPDSEAEEPIKDWMPTAGDPAVALDADEPPEIEIADGQTVYCRVTTTPKGIIEEAPTIEAATTPEAGTHFQPPDKDTAGDLFFPLCNITIEGDPAVVTLEQIQQGGPIDVVPNLPEMRNVGDKREVFKTRESAGDTYDFRTLEQLEGASDWFPIMKAEPEDPGEADDLETIQWKYLTQRATEAQVQLEDVDDGNGIRVKGNDYYTSESGVRKFTIEVKDGLIEELTKDASGSGWWGTVSFQFSPAGGGSFQTLSLDFEDGILVAVTNSQGTTGAGTEDDEGVSVFQFGDT